MMLEMKTADELMAGSAHHRGRRARRETSLVRRILRSLIVRGEPIPVRDIVAAADDYPEELIYDALVSLDDEDFISLRGRYIDGAAPVWARQTDFAVHVFGGHWRYARGAVDALGIPLMVGEQVAIRSYCHDCDAPLRVSAGPHGATAGPARDRALGWRGFRRARRSGRRPGTGDDVLSVAGSSARVASQS
jgi:Alkylmercury lyase